ncbi:MAG: ABC transporter ATP-binding protein [Psychroflexus halocasei]
MEIKKQTQSNSELDKRQKGETLVEVTNLSKKFCKDLKTSLWYGVKDLVSGYTGNKKERALRPKEFWAVKDISFTLRRGECLGLIGHNGAGKSTLLKILNGLINPDDGKVVMRGRVGALIELGAGFNPVLSGRENIYNNGAILGFSREEINNKLKDIIEFAELEEFIDMPVRNYSSGMKVRLGFAVAAQMEPDVLIIDEVLAVGDLGFVLKCFKTIDTILPKTAIIFVSHSMPMISRICNQIILMDRGKPKFQGENVSKAIDLYYTRFSDNSSNVVFTDDTIKLKNIDIPNVPRVENLPQVNWDETLELEIEFETTLKKLPCITVVIFDKEQRPVALIEPLEDEGVLDSKSLKYNIKVPNIQLSKGIYNINISASDKPNSTPRLRINSVQSFQIIHDQETWPPFLLKSFTQVNN